MKSINKQDPRKNSNKKSYFDLFRIPRFQNLSKVVHVSKIFKKIVKAKFEVDKEDAKKNTNT
jgi:uncharacterized membrane protein YjjP (DUF1212 family)